MQEEIRGRKDICRFLGVSCWVTAKKLLRGLESAAGIKLLVYENGRPVISKSVYLQMRMRLMTK
jgi:hypothetical protein